MKKVNNFDFWFIKNLFNLYVISLRYINMEFLEYKIKIWIFFDNYKYFDILVR